MNTAKITSTVSSLVFASLLVAGTAGAHSNHDHSHLSVGWTFDSKVMNKIEKNMGLGLKKTGLSSLEQDVLNHYGIKEGNSFNTRIGERMMKVTRTSSGIRIENPVVAYTDGLQKNLPIHAQANVVRSSINKNHTGHDHGHLKLSWVFSETIKQKINYKMADHRSSKAVGLSTKQQKILKRYGINVGNTFLATVDGKTFTMKRTSMGLKILNELNGRAVASVPGAHQDVY